MFHPYASIYGVFDDPTDGYKGPHNCIWSHEFYETDLSRDFVRGFIYECARGRTTDKDVRNLRSDIRSDVDTVYSWLRPERYPPKQRPWRVPESS